MTIYVIRRMRIACWVTEATDTHSDFVILTANRQQQWLRERPLSVTLYFYCPTCYHLVLTLYAELK
jgi:hypothetical protein